MLQISHSCAQATHISHVTPPLQHTGPFKTVRTTQGKVGKREMQLPWLELSQGTGAKPTLLWSCSESFGCHTCAGHFYSIWMQSGRTSCCVCLQKSRGSISVLRKYQIRSWCCALFPWRRAFGDVQHSRVMGGQVMASSTIPDLSHKASAAISAQASITVSPLT